MDLFNLNTVSIPEKYSHPLGGYSPEELGLDLPGVNRLHIDGHCGGDSHHRNDKTVGLFNAHTHMCPFEEQNRSICIIKEYLRNSDGTMSDVLIHEHAHALQEMPLKIIGHGPVAMSHIIKRVGFLGKLTDADGDDWDKESHGPSFMRALRTLGRPDLCKPHTNSPVY